MISLFILIPLLYYHKVNDFSFDYAPKISVGIPPPPAINLDSKRLGTCYCMYSTVCDGDLCPVVTACAYRQEVCWCHQ